MPDLDLTVGELFKAKAITDEQVKASVDAYLAKPEANAHPIADGQRPVVFRLEAVVREVVVKRDGFYGPRRSGPRLVGYGQTIDPYD